MTVRQDAADTDGGSVKDAIGILTLGTEFALIAFLIYLFRPSEFPGRILLSLFSHPGSRCADVLAFEGFIRKCGCMA